MADDTRKLQNVQLTRQPSDGFGPRIVEPDGSAGGAILDGSIPSAAEQNIERRPCDCETAVKNSENGIFIRYADCCLLRGKHIGQDVVCRRR